MNSNEIIEGEVISSTTEPATVPAIRSDSVITYLNALATNLNAMVNDLNMQVQQITASMQKDTTENG